MFKKKIIYYFFFTAAVLVCFVFLFIEINIKSASTDPANNVQKNPAPVKPAIGTVSITNTVDLTNQAPTTTPQNSDNSSLTKFSLAIPYINESPDGSWSGPWKNACEEASIAMVEYYYLGKQTVSIKNAMSFLSNLFTIENKIFGSNANTDAKQTTQLINEHTSFNGLIKLNPTISDIKKELQQKRPVIVPVFGFDLKNKNIPFLAPPRGTAYHMLVIGGYDDTTKEFITEDSGDIVDGVNHRYTYDIVMNALHDYNYATNRVDGPPTAIFTFPELAKVADSPRVYYLKGTQKQYISSPTAFNAKKFSWDAINVVEQKWLDNFTQGPDIN